MGRAHHIALVASLFTMGLSGCDGAGPVSDPESEVRCFGSAGGSAGSIIALEDVSVSGNVSIVGSDSSAVFGNEGVRLSGDLDIEPDIISASTVDRTEAGMKLRGDVVEHATPVLAIPDDAAASRAADDNDNDALTMGDASPIKDGELRLSGGDVLNVPPGTYDFPEGMRVSGDSYLVLGGDVTIYVNGKVSLSGSTTTNDGSSHILEIISVGDDQIHLSGSSESTRLHISAPLAEVALSGSTNFEGSILGRTVRLSGRADLDIGPAGDEHEIVVECNGDRPPDLPDSPE